MHTEPGERQRASRAHECNGCRGQQKAARGRAGAAVVSIIAKRCEKASVLGRPGSDLLFQALRLSTIGAGEFYGRVRDGIGYKLPATATKPAKDRRKLVTMHR